LDILLNFERAKKVLLLERLEEKPTRAFGLLKKESDVYTDERTKRANALERK